MITRSTLASALSSRAPALLDDAPWPPATALRWTPERVAELFPLLDPVRHSAPDGVFWNVDQGLADANRRLPDGGFVFTGGFHEEAAVGTAAFFRAERPQYFSGSLLDRDGVAAPELQPVEPLVAALSNGTTGASVSLKAWWGTAGAVTPLHYDTQHSTPLLASEPQASSRLRYSRVRAHRRDRRVRAAAR